MILCWYKLVFVQFERTLELVLCTAVYPVDNMSGDSDHPCLLVTCPHNELAVKLFQHIIKRKKFNTEFNNQTDTVEIAESLVKQGIDDQRVSTCVYLCHTILSADVLAQLAALVKVMPRLNIIDEKQVERMIQGCASEGFLYSCVELLRIVPYPLIHPFITILEVSNLPLHTTLNQMLYAHTMYS